MTNLTYGILPSFMWSLIMPIMYLVGVFHHLLNTVLHFELNYCMYCHILSVYVPCRLDSSPTHSHSHPTMEQKRWYVTIAFWLHENRACMCVFIDIINIVCFFFSFLFCTFHSTGCFFKSQSVWIQELNTTV